MLWLSSLVFFSELQKTYGSKNEEDVATVKKIYNDVHIQVWQSPLFFQKQSTNLDILNCSFIVPE